MKYIKHLLVACCLFIVSLARADEGMWLPLLLEKLNEKQMKSLGMKISAKDIYNINSGSLKDAIVSFGGFCTGEIISGNGLVLTNHHCGFDAVQNHSTVENNYIRDGFWSTSNKEELPNPGLFVTFIVRIEDVSKQALAGVTSGMAESERQSIIDKNINAINASAKKLEDQQSFVRGFFEGNQYYLFVTETYNDVRLVGAPPASIGNFGHDTDNWMWPRHTGDFSMFRIYAGKNNRPAKYSVDNVPYIPKRSLSISLDGMAKNDFTMVFGFPGRTNEYLYSAAVQQIVEVNDPAKIAIREKALAVLDGYMRSSERINIQYAAKYAGIQNAYKKWQGEVLGLTRTKGVEKKKAYEAIFQQRVNANSTWKNSYGNLLGDLETAYASLKPYGYARDYYLETTIKIELLTVASWMNSLKTAYEKDGEKGYAARLATVKNQLEGFFGEYNAKVDRDLFVAMMTMYAFNQEANYQSPVFKKWMEENEQSVAKIADKMYGETLLTDAAKLSALLDKPAADVIAVVKNEMATRLQADLVKTYSGEVAKTLNEIQAQINKLNRTYMQAQMDVYKEKTFYPDANSTLRVTYGKVNGYYPRDGVEYDFYTYLDGVMEKYVPNDYEFDVPEKLRTLYRNKDYGPYGMNGKMPVCFIATNHTTGGNSGSPALDAWGNLVGLNFDRVWEGTMSDINYDPSICRNIMVDIRYVLFIIDKYASADRLIKEMKLVHPKKKK